MSDDPTTAPASPVTQTPSTPAASAPVRPSAPVASPTNSVFRDEPAPEWVREAGLDEAHKKGTDAAPAVPPAEPAAGQPPPAAPAATPAPATPQPFDPNSITKAITDAIAAARQPQQPGEPQRNEAEMAKQLGIFTVTPDIYRAINGVEGTPEQVTALNNAFQGVAKQAVTVASVIFQQQLKQFQDSLTPYTNVVREQEATRQRETFFKENADLSGFEELVRQQFQLALASGKTFPDVASARKYVAEQTRSVLKASGIQLPAPGANGNQSRSSSPAPQPARQMTPTSVGGRTGSAGKEKPLDTREAVWGR